MRWSAVDLKCRAPGRPPKCWIDRGGTPETELAEGEGFEPPVPLRVRLISSQVPSTTQPPFRDSLSPKPVRSGGLRKTVAPAKARNVFLRCYATGFPASPASPKTALSCDPPQDPRPRKIRMLREWAIANASRHQTAAGPIPWCLQRKSPVRQRDGAEVRVGSDHTPPSRTARM